MPRGIAQAQPDEVKQFMNQNPRKLGARAIEDDAAFAQKGTGVNRSAAVAQTGSALEANRRPAKSGQTPGYGANRAREGGVRQLVTNL